LALLNLLPESPERDIRELELRQSVVQTLYVLKGYAAPETVAATERAAELAEKSGNFAHLVNWATSRSLNALVSGALSAAGAILDQTLEFALLQGTHIDLGSVHQLQTITRY
jgi:hypothetical protein